MFFSRYMLALRFSRPIRCSNAADSSCALGRCGHVQIFANGLHTNVTPWALQQTVHRWRVAAIEDRIRGIRAHRVDSRASSNAVGCPRMIGMITKSDIVAQISRCGADSCSASVYTIMIGEVCSCRTSEWLRDVWTASKARGLQSPPGDRQRRQTYRHFLVARRSSASARRRGGRGSTASPIRDEWRYRRWLYSDFECASTKQLIVRYGVLQRSRFVVT